MDELRAYGVCQSCFEPYLARRGCQRCDRGADTRTPVTDAASVLPVDIELERQIEPHRIMPRPVFALLGAALVVVTLIAAAIQAA
jgi:hypothetical protein